MFAGLSSFVGTMYAGASTFLCTHIIIATTARERLELALTTMRLLESHPIGERRLSRLCAADSDLSATVELHVDLTASLCLHTCLSAVGCKRTLFSLKPLPGLTSCLIQLRFKGHRQHESTLQSLKRLKQGMPLAVNELWDAHNGNFVDDTASMAKLIQDAAQDRQGRVTSSLCMARVCLTSGVPISANVVSVSSAMKSRI